ncbi:uncharacterized protein LOC131251664 [Magnolia sinica]|uniref:uncharacterized protein LOC131251664 n=1 Tax=Magnolia sinica TaxID=86752 RepID=UPI00265B2506|nr:uncharacterized protein LOC131251664 [Magnolia sinica]
MSVAVVNGVTVTAFVEDGAAFNKCMEERFSTLDVNGDGVLSRAELLRGFGPLPVRGADAETGEEIGNPDDEVFEKFDADRSGTVDLEEFKAEMKEIMLAVARGIGDSPIQIALESDSFLMRAVEHESTKRV